MPKVREQHLEARRRQILDGAAVCFARKGFRQTTMQDICRETELSMGAVYRYFSSKERIIEAMAEAAQRRREELVAAMREATSTGEALEALSHTFFSMLEYDAEAWALEPELWAEALRNPRVAGVVKSTAQGVREPVAEFVREAQEQGEMDPELDADSVARVIVSLFDGLVLQRALDRELDVWRYVEVIRALMGGTFRRDAHVR
jgi:AcrR family transcriptional regulator